MKILILGAGRTGASVASVLAKEENDIVVIDTKADLLQQLKERLDIGVVAGNAAHPAILEQAGADTADMVIAATDRDETNMLACQIINILYHRPKTIARVRAMEYLSAPELFQEGGFPIDIVISPEQIVMESIRNLIEYPGVMHLSEFADGRIRLFSVRVSRRGLLLGKKISSVHDHLGDATIRVAAIFRGGDAVIPEGDVVIEDRDEVFFVAPRDAIRPVLEALDKVEPPIKRIMIAGGGHIGKRLALALERDHNVKVIEFNARRVAKIANELEHSIVLHGDCTDENLLLNESIDKVDLFCAITDQDGNNIISASLAKRLGARKSYCLLNHANYAKLIEHTGIDVVVIPDQSTIGFILKHVRRGDVAQVNALCGGTAEAIEAVVHRGTRSRSVVGLRVDEVKLQKGVVLGALVRNGTPVSIHRHTVFEEGDHVVMFALDKRLIKNVENVFQPV